MQNDEHTTPDTALLSVNSTIVFVFAKVTNFMLCVFAPTQSPVPHFVTQKPKQKNATTKKHPKNTHSLKRNLGRGSQPMGERGQRRKWGGGGGCRKRKRGR